MEATATSREGAEFGFNTAQDVISAFARRFAPNFYRYYAEHPIFRAILVHSNHNLDTTVGKITLRRLLAGFFANVICENIRQRLAGAITLAERKQGEGLLAEVSSFIEIEIGVPRAEIPLKSDIEHLT